MQELKGVKPEGAAYKEEPEVVKSYGDTVPIEDIGKIANLQGSEALRIEFPTEEGPMVVLLAGDEISFKGRRKDEEGQPYYSYTYRVRTDEGTYKGELRIYRNEDGRPYIEFHSDKGTFTYLPVKKEEGWPVGKGITLYRRCSASEGGRYISQGGRRAGREYERLYS